MAWHELLSRTPEFKKKRFLQSVSMLFKQRTSIKKTGKLTNYNSNGEMFMTQSILLKQNEISFSFKVIRLIFKSSIWPILSTSLMVSLRIQPNCLVSLPET